MRNPTASVCALRIRDGVRRGRVGLVTLLVALFAAGWLLARPQPPTRSSEPAGADGPAGATLAGRWPDARVGRASGTLIDGQAYTPMAYLELDVSIGTAPAVDDGTTRLLVRDGQTVRELARIPTDVSLVMAVTRAGDDLVWLTATRAPGGPATLHAAALRGATPARQLTGDLGAVVHTGSRYDLAVADGRVHWAALPAGEPTTELRSVPIQGGTVEVRRIDGRYTLSAWPWLVSAAATGNPPIELRNPATGSRIVVPRGRGEGMTCTPALCRFQTPGPPGWPSRTELMRPDGTRRILVAAGATTPVLGEIGLADRFELLTQPSGGSQSRRLILYDIRTNRSTVLVDPLLRLGARDGFVWWSTTDAGQVTWSALDLRTLS
jgi:hypothetical protein